MWAASAFLALLAAPSSAERYSYPSPDRALFSVEVLNSWTVEIEDPILHAGSPECAHDRVEQRSKRDSLPGATGLDVPRAT